MKQFLICLASFLLAAAALADDEVTLYELLPPETHQFAITYDVTQAREGAEFFFNPIRAGSTASKWSAERRPRAAGSSRRRLPTTRSSSA
jgi:hypothetical protein